MDLSEHYDVIHRKNGLEGKLNLPAFSFDRKNCRQILVYCSWSTKTFAGIFLHLVTT